MATTLITKESQKEAYNSLRVRIDNLRSQHAQLLANLMATEAQIKTLKTSVGAITTEVSATVVQAGSIICTQDNTIYDGLDATNYTGDPKHCIYYNNIDDVVTNVAPNP